MQNTILSTKTQNRSKAVYSNGKTMTHLKNMSKWQVFYMFCDFPTAAKKSNSILAYSINE